MGQQIIWGWLLIINVAAFALYGADKRRAVRKQWRVPEVQLLLVAAIGGAAGAWAGMEVFRHKTRKWKFRILVPAMLFVQIGILRYFG